MGYIIGVILVILALYLIFFRICWTITKPIFIFLYEKIIRFFTNLGMSVSAAKALISLVIIIIILCLLF